MSGEEALEYINKLADILDKANHNADWPALPSESKEKADYLFEQAISIIEEMTGKEWEFTWLSWSM